MSEPLQIVVNGTEHTVEADTTLAHLLEQLGVDRNGVAVAVDREVVPRSELHKRTVHAGARVEVIRAVGGG